MRLYSFLTVLLIFLVISCTPNPIIIPQHIQEEGSDPQPKLPSPTSESIKDKWALWINGTQLRGANIYQRPVMPALDGDKFMGSGIYGPPYIQDDFDRLAALGANYVNIQLAGLYTIEPPYVVNEAAVANLDRLLIMITKADMFAVITFHSGPGRSVFSILRGGAGTSFDKDYLIENVWNDHDAQAAWADMWAYTAERYKDNPVVVGYDLMCEPNSNSIVNTWSPEDFQSDYGGSGYDWNVWMPNIVSAIRKVDSQTPILISPNGYGGIQWLPYIKVVDAPRIVYAFHQYSPQQYTHQKVSDRLVYPGLLDTDKDGSTDVFDRTWLKDLLKIGYDFAVSNKVPVVVNEYGVMRWAPGIDVFIADETEMFEQYGWNYAIWMWYPSWEPFVKVEKTFNFRLGPVVESTTDTPNPIFSNIVGFWEHNTIRPSDMH